jgi:hypothetical protein
VVEPAAVLIDDRLNLVAVRHDEFFGRHRIAVTSAVASPRLTRAPA